MPKGGKMLTDDFQILFGAPPGLRPFKNWWLKWYR